MSVRRHVFAEPEKEANHYQALDLSTKTGDHNYVSASSKFFAVAVKGGAGKVLAIPFDQHGKVPREQPGIQGHKDDVTDTQWNPFNDNMLATGSVDSTVKIWSIPDGGLTEKMTEPLGTLAGHSKDVTLLQWHPTASNVLMTAARDPSVKLWDVETSTDKLTIDGSFGGLLSDVRFNCTGALVAASSKDKVVRTFDPRAGATAVGEVMAHEGAKVVNLTFLGERDYLLTTGFTRTSRREFKIWDPRKFGEALTTVDIDQSAGVLMPFYDDDSNLLYLAGKGDGNMRYYELEYDGGGVTAFGIGDFKTSDSTKGMCMLPKRCVDVGRCETARFVKLLRDRALVVSFIVPRKSDAFQTDLYPDTCSPFPAMSATDYFAGKNYPAKKMSMDPAKNGGMTTASVSVSIKARETSPDSPAAAAAASSSSASPVASAAGASSSGSKTPTAAASGAGGASGSSSAADKAEIARLQERLIAVERDNADLQDKLSAAEESAAAANATLAEIKAQVDSVNEENAELKSRLEAMQVQLAAAAEATA